MTTPMFQDPDDELDSVKRELACISAFERRSADAIRRTYDMLLDGTNTGRYRWDQLHKTEKTHFGTLIEINLQREFKFEDGKTLDYSINGIDVDCKYSHGEAWMIPPEAQNELCFVVSANDQESKWSMGIVRARETYLNLGRNRDAKATLNSAGRANIRWVHRNRPLPENVLLHLPQEDIDAIFASTSGQQRVNELFTRAQHRIIRRAVVSTVAQQLDPMRRIRKGGGSRRDLQKHGIIVLGHYSGHIKAAVALDLPEPTNGEVVSARIVRKRPHHAGRSTFTAVDGTEYAVALPDDPEEPAPDIDYMTQ